MNDTRVALHLGCGKRYIPGFIHIDLADFPHIDYRHDIRKLPFLEDNSVDLIYVCHAFEYFDRFEARDVLTEWHRVLRVGGTLRLAVPDFESIVYVYREHQKLEMALGLLYGRMPVETPQGTQYFYHKTVYDFESLGSLLTSCGFAGARRYDWRNTVHRDYDDFSQAYIPHMDKEHGLLMSLNVETLKL